MNDLNVLIDKCRQTGQVSLRFLWPGRGKTVTERRAKVKTLFGNRQEVKENDVVVATIVYDKIRGIYQLAS